MNGRAGSGPGTHNAPLFPAEEVSLSQLEKKNVYDWLGVGNSGLLMLVCSNVRITGVFSIFGVTFYVVVWDPLKLEVFIKGLQSGGFLCVWLLLVFQQGDMVLLRRALSESNFFDCCTEAACEGGLDVIVKYGTGRRPQGLSWVRTRLFVFRRIFLSLTYPLICPSTLLCPWVVQKLEWPL